MKQSYPPWSQLSLHWDSRLTCLFPRLSQRSLHLPGHVVSSSTNLSWLLRSQCCLLKSLLFCFNGGSHFCKSLFVRKSFVTFKFIHVCFSLFLSLYLMLSLLSHIVLLFCIPLSSMFTQEEKEVCAWKCFSSWFWSNSLKACPP